MNNIKSVSGVYIVKKIGDFLYTFMLTVLAGFATFLLLVLILGVADPDKFVYFVFEFFPREVVFGFFAVIVFIVLAFLVYNAIMFVVNIVKRRGRDVFSCILTGTSMTAGVVVIIFMVLRSGVFDAVIKNLSDALLV